MKFSDQELISKTSAGDLRAVARLITLAEARVPRARTVQAALYAKTGKAHVIGVTGSPGAGKSTLVDQLAYHYRKAGKRVAVLAVDPSSPFSGGALLGDRIRMTRSIEDDGIYIRSMATRGALGGLSRATLDATQILDSAGFEIILIETVGVGQAEVDIARLADTCLVVLVPGMGDSVQSIKAGILEIADHFVINKADRDGADLLQKDLRMLLSLGEHSAEDWLPEICRTIATSGEGVLELIQLTEKHMEWIRKSEKGRLKKLSIISHAILKLASDLTLERVLYQKSELLEKLSVECFEKRTNPYAAVDLLLS